MMKKIALSLIGLLYGFSLCAQETQLDFFDKNLIDDYSLTSEWFIQKNVKKIQASSTLAPQGGNTYTVSNLNDGNLKTSWVEGVSGYGIGEWVEYSFGAGTIINSITIANGYVKSQSSWENNSRVKKLKVYFNGIAFAILNLDDSRSIQSYNFLRGIGLEQRDWTLRFEILEVYKGKKFDDTALSGIHFDSPRQSAKGVKINVPSVDLGLSVKWASCNIGATNPEQRGASFDWDSAHQLEKDGWRLPTKEEFMELIQKCEKKWITQNGVKGFLFTATNGNTIFIPAAGGNGCLETELGRLADIDGENVYGHYWSGSAEIVEHEIDGVDIWREVYGLSMQITEDGTTVGQFGDSGDESLSCYPIRMVRK